MQCDTISDILKINACTHSTKPNDIFCVHKIFNIENVAPTTHELDISRIQSGGARVKTHSNIYIYAFDVYIQTLSDVCQ